MSRFKNNPLLKLYYSDTDSIFINLTPEQLNEVFKDKYPDGIVNSKILGRLKLENIIDKAIFIGPKAYFLKTVDGKEIVKIKGLKNRDTITFEQFKTLLVKDGNLSVNQNKWFKHFDEGTITILEHSYNIRLTDNKRDLILNVNGILIGTKPKNIELH